MLNNIKHYYKKFILILLVVVFQSCETEKEIINHKIEEKAITEENSDNSFYEKHSKILNIKLSGSENKELIKEVSEWLGTPYKYASNTKSGTDCSGFVQAIYLKIYHISLYRSSFDQLKNVRPINKTELQTGDLVFFVTFGNKVSHVGIYINDNKFIHASTKRGVVVNDLNEEYYQKNFHTAGRVITNY